MPQNRTFPDPVWPNANHKEGHYNAVSYPLTAYGSQPWTTPRVSPSIYVVPFPPPSADTSIPAISETPDRLAGMGGEDCTIINTRTPGPIAAAIYTVWAKRFMGFFNQTSTVNNCKENNLAYILQIKHEIASNVMADHLSCYTFLTEYWNVDIFLTAQQPILHFKIIILLKAGMALRLACREECFN